MNNKVFIIAEIGQAHEGSLGIAHSYIDAIANTGVDAIKFQTHIADAESSEFEPFRIPFSYEDKSRFDYWRRMEFTEEQWLGLKQHCDEKNVEFISSPFSNAAVDLLEKVQVNKYKVGSGEISNHLLLNRIAKTKKDVILSSGLSNWNELDSAVDIFRNTNVQVSVLQCTTAYPTKPEQWGLNVIQLLQSRYKLPVGFSDHSGDIYACLAACTLGATILEFHVVFDKKMFGPDSTSSLNLREVYTLVKGVRQIETALAQEVDKNDLGILKPLKNIFEKSLAINKNLAAHHILTFEDLDAKKPSGRGIPASNYQSVIGRKLNKPKSIWEFLHAEDLI